MTVLRDGGATCLFLVRQAVLAQSWVVGCLGGFTEGLLRGLGGAEDRRESRQAPDAEEL